MKKIFSCALAFALSLMFSVWAFAFENTVDDYAMLFTQEERAEILTSAEMFSETTGYSLAVLTIDYAQGHTSEEYADDYHDNLIDSEGWSENSMLFLIDMDNRNVWISTTGEAIYTYDDYTVDYVIDSGYNELSNGEYAQAILLMIETAQNEAAYSENEGEIIEEHYYYFPENNFDDYYYSDYDYGKNSFDFSDIIVYIVIGLVIAAITVFVVKSKYKNYGKGDEFDEDDMTLNLTGSTDNVISRNVVTTKIPRNNNHGRPGGGGHHGGSSVHRSSGGRSHGGGGRSF